MRAGLAAILAGAGSSHDCADEARPGSAGPRCRVLGLHLRLHLRLLRKAARALQMRTDGRSTFDGGLGLCRDGASVEHDGHTPLSQWRGRYLGGRCGGRG